MEPITIEKKKTKAIVKREVDEGYVVKIADAIESRVILSDLQKRLIDKMGYQIKYTKNNGEVSIVEDLTSKAYFEIGKQEEVRKKTLYIFGKPETSETDKDVTVLISCTDKKTGKVEWGTAMEPKFDKWGNPDKFAKQKCLTKAQRNSIKDLLSYEVVTKCFAMWVQSKNILIAEVKNNKLLIEGDTGEEAKAITAEVEPPKEKSMGDNQKLIGESAFYAQVKSINTHWKINIDAGLLKSYYKKQHKVDHFKDLPIETIKKICNELYFINKDRSKSFDLVAVCQEMK